MVTQHLTGPWGSEFYPVPAGTLSKSLCGQGLGFLICEVGRWAGMARGRPPHRGRLLRLFWGPLPTGGSFLLVGQAALSHRKVVVTPPPPHQHRVKVARGQAVLPPWVGWRLLPVRCPTCLILDMAALLEPLRADVGGVSSQLVAAVQKLSSHIVGEGEVFTPSGKGLGAGVGSRMSLHVPSG